MAKPSKPADYGVEAGTVLLGKYRVDSILGHGGMGVVAQCTHLQLEERVAIKFLRDDVTLDDETRRRFMREAQNAVKLKSEHVARVTDVGTFPETGVPYMVMEFLEGIDLGQMLEESGKINPSLAVELLLQASVALAEAHSLGIVHRDIKPGNLFVTWRADGSPLLKILDFGISKAPVGADMNLTQTQSLLGTPAYMSPEQMRSARTVDPRSDIWSLGTVLYEILQGRRPFEAESFSEMCVKVAVDPPAPLTAPCPPGLEKVIKRALEKDPDARYQSIAEMARDLAPFARDKNSAIVMVERMSRMLGRNRPTSFDRSEHSSGDAIPRGMRDAKSAPVSLPRSTKDGTAPLRNSRDSDNLAIGDITQADVEVDSLPGEPTAITRLDATGTSVVALTDTADETGQRRIHAADSAQHATVQDELNWTADPTKSPWTPEKITAQTDATKVTAAPARPGPARLPGTTTTPGTPPAPSAGTPPAGAAPAAPPPAQQVISTLPGLFATSVPHKRSPTPLQSPAHGSQTSIQPPQSAMQNQAAPTALLAATARPTVDALEGSLRPRRPIWILVGAGIVAFAIALFVAFSGGDGPDEGSTDRESMGDEVTPPAPPPDPNAVMPATPPDPGGKDPAGVVDPPEPPPSSILPSTTDKGTTDKGTTDKGTIKGAAGGGKGGTGKGGKADIRKGGDRDKGSHKGDRPEKSDKPDRPDKADRPDKPAATDPFKTRDPIRTRDPRAPR